MKVALVHDWLTGMRGGEKVLEAFLEIFPQADLYTLFHFKGSVSSLIEKRKIITSFLQKLPLINPNYRYFLALFPKAAEGLKLKGYDLVISSSHCVAKGVTILNKAPHICYCYTPMRYAWIFPEQYFSSKRAFLLPLLSYLKKWDLKANQRVDHFIAISKNVSQRIKNIYQRDSEIIHCPVETKHFSISTITQDYYLIVSAFAPYKRVNLAIQAFNKLKLPLKIIGEGQDEKKLKAMAKENIKFLGWQADPVILNNYYSHCKALIFPGEEDFGIVPVEAMAAGCPVIAYGKGGALETVTEKTGIFFKEQTEECLIEAIQRFEENKGNFDPKIIREQALKFDKEIFKDKIKKYLSEKNLLI